MKLERGICQFKRINYESSAEILLGLLLMLVTSCVKDKTFAKIPVLSTTVVSEFTENTAVCGGSITKDGGADIIERGVCWDTEINPTIKLSSKTSDGSGIGDFISSITGLYPNTTYHVRAYATNAAGTAYGNDRTFNTTPAIITTAISSITSTSATSGGNIAGDGEVMIISRGVCWSNYPNPTISYDNTSDGTGAGQFVSSITGLTANTNYYVRAYATNPSGTFYGNEISFKSGAQLPSLYTSSISSISSTGASCGGNISNDGGAPIIVRGVCWSTNTGPTVDLATKTSDGNGIGYFVSSIQGLTPITRYYVRAYATNSVGTAYGYENSFTTNAMPPVLTTTAITSITATTAISGGSITSDGGGLISAKGVCWNTSPNPTIALTTKTNNGTGTLPFTSSVTGLLPGTIYYLRAYATNNGGTAYGNEISFTTNITLPAISTTSIRSVTSTTAICGGNVSGDGGSIVTSRGVCWSTDPSPNVSLSTKTTNGTGTGTFTSSITGLLANTNYFVRAYATNSVGTVYGNELILKSFTGTISDIESNLYNTVTIGTQVWMAENLKTTKYNDGTGIPNVTDNNTWLYLSTPAYCWYNNSASSYKTTYGALYNWYAVDPTNNGGKNVCPAGWHVPTDIEWNILTTYLGGSSTGGKLKEQGTSHWLSPNTNADNTSGFTGLPGGYRYSSFSNLYNTGKWWSSAAYNADRAWNFLLSYSSGTAGTEYNYKIYGYSVRCLKD